LCPKLVTWKVFSSVLWLMIETVSRVFNIVLGT
jgi:hypothetical protein